MAKNKINFNILKKTAKTHGVIYFCKENKFYILNDFISVIIPCEKIDMNEIIKNTGAVEDENIISMLENVLNEATEDTKDTHVFYENEDGVYKYFKNTQCVIKMDTKLLKIVDKLNYKKVRSSKSTKPLVFSVDDIQIIITPAYHTKKEISLIDFIKNNM